MNAQQLRNSILQQAIQGKLVPQDPADEPASVLLQRIRKEKERLVKEGKLKKKDLESKPIEEGEIPFEIPESWEWVRLKSIVSVLGDGIHGTPEYDISGRYYFINGNNLSKNKIVIKASTGRVNEIEYQKYKKELSNRTILVSINGTIGNVGHYNGEPVILGKSACYFNLISVELKEYVTLLLYTDYFLKYAIENATGSTIKNVSLAVMKDFLLPLPPLAEQRRIVAKIEELMPLVERYGKAQQALDQLNESLPARLRQSILQEAIQGRLVPQDPKEEPASELLKRIRKEKEQLVKEGKLKKKDLESKPIEEDEIPFEVPEGWEWSKIGAICTITNGFTPLRSEEKYWKNGDVNWFTVEDIREQGEHIRYTKQKITSIATTPERIVRPGSVLLCCTASVGQCAITHIPTTTNQQFNALTVRNEYRQLISDDYLFLFSKTLKDVLHRLSGKTTFEFVSVKKVGDILIPLPPLSEQKRIVAKVEELFGVIKK